MAAPGPNLYAPPTGQAPPPAGSSGEPRHLSTVLIILIVLSALGILASLMGLVSAATGLGSQPPPPTPGLPPSFVEAQAKMYEEMREASLPGAAAFVSLVAGSIDAAVMYAAILAKGGRERGRQLLVDRGLPLVMAFTVFKLAWTLLITIRTYEVVQRFVERMQVGMGGGAAGSASTIMKTAVMGGVIGGAVVALAWSALLVAFYAWSRKVLAGQNVAAHFARTS
jgi:hypothetical protein